MQSSTGAHAQLQNYLMNVLGIRWIQSFPPIVKEAKASQNNSVQERSEESLPSFLGVLFLVPEVMTKEEDELLKKVIDACKLGADQILRMTENQYRTFRNQNKTLDEGTTVVSFLKQDSAETLEDLDFLLRAPMLAELSQSTDLKKKLWGDLKQRLEIFHGRMRNRILLCLIAFLPLFAWGDCYTHLQLEGTVGAGTLDYFERGLKDAESKKCSSVLLEINTPGGNLQTTRLIVEKILSSPRPILCVVSPQGGHAGSAGAIILQACHVAGALDATNLGAATPVTGGGESLSEDLRKKVLNDTVSWVRGLAKLRNRSEKFAEDIVREAKALSANEALKAGAIECGGKTIEDFLSCAKGREVEIAEGKRVKVSFEQGQRFATDFRFQVLEFLSDPQIAYLLFIGSLGLLYFEFTHPGVIAPGVVGGLGLILSLISFHKLAVWWGGVALMLLGIVLLIAEMFVPSFGILGIGGIAAFTLGGLFLFNFETAGFELPLSLILPTAIGLFLLMLFLGRLAMQTFRVRKTMGADYVLNRKAQVKSLSSSSGKEGYVLVECELWKFISNETVVIGDTVTVESVEGLTAKIKK